MATQTLTGGLNLIPRLSFNGNNIRLPAVRSSPLPLNSTAELRLINRRKPISHRCSAARAAAASGSVAPAISVTDNALTHLNKMRSEKNEDLCLRIGVKQGGCSGLSYTMEFENQANTRPDDSIMEYNGFVIDWGTMLKQNKKISQLCDPKSLLFLYGMQLDFSDALIGGGFSFKNPNATQACGCGKSFAAEM